MNMILIAGNARHGKDTVATYIDNFLKDAYDFRSTILPLGRYLKYICRNFCNWDGIKNEYGRTLLQNIGEKYRKEDINFWIKHIEYNLKMSPFNFDHVIISDCRYLNEMTYWKHKGYKVTTIKVTRVLDDYKYFDNGLTEEQKKHASETELLHYDFDIELINKNNELDYLYKQIDEKVMDNIL